MTRAHPLPCTVPPVLEPAEFRNNVAVARGSPVALPCEAQGNPLPLVSWMKDGEPLLLQSLEQGPSLQLETAGAGDSGTYSCVAVSEAGEARRHFQLTVMGGSSAPPPRPRTSIPGPGRGGRASGGDGGGREGRGCPRGLEQGLGNRHRGGSILLGLPPQSCPQTMESRGRSH